MKITDAPTEVLQTRATEISISLLQAELASIQAELARRTQPIEPPTGTPEVEQGEVTGTMDLQAHEEE